MLFITDGEFLRTVSQKRNQYLARKLYESGAVTRIHIEFVHDRYEIVGTVFVNDTIYTPHIYVTKYSKIIETSCDCEFYDAYTACAHAGAVILAVQDLAPNHFPFDYEADVTAARKRKEEAALTYQEKLRREWEDRRISALESVSETLTNDFRNQMYQTFSESHEPVHIIAYHDYRNYSTIRFKVGRERYYIIKDIAQFISRMDNHEYYNYGKNFAWVHNYQDLDEKSKKIYDFMRAQQRRNTDYYYGNQAVGFSGYMVDALYHLLEENPQAVKDLTMVEDNEKMTISTTRNDRDVIYRLDIKHQDVHNYFAGKNNLYYLTYERNNRCIIHYIKGDERGVFVKLLEAFNQNNDTIYVPLNKESDFYRYLISPIKDVIEFQGDINLQEEDRLEIYGDINTEEEAYFNVLGIYSEEKINLIEKPDTPHSATADLVLKYLEDHSTGNDENYYYFDTRVDESMDFLDRGIAFLQNYADIYVSDNLKKIGTKAKMKVKVGITVSNNLLSVDIDSIGIPKEELAAVMNSFKKKKKYHKLKNGEMIYIESDELAEVNEMMDRYHLLPKDLKDGHVDMNLNRAYSLDMTANEMSHIEVDRSEAFKDIIDELTNYKAHQHEINDQFGHILRDYQKDGYQWLSTMTDLHFGGILADDMGLGKTLQMIALLENQPEHFSIVVCPSSLVLNWNDEFDKFSSHLRNVCVMGSADKRKEIIEHAKDYDVLVTSYDYIRRDIDLYKGLKFDFVILDEAQYIKNQQTKNAQSVKELDGKQKFALTGTPIENSLAELWSIFDFLNKGYLFNYNYFKKAYEAPIVRSHDEEKSNELKKLISPFILRRTKKEVLKELPDKVEKTLTIDFEEDERKLYYANLVEANKELASMDSKKDRIEILAMLTRLRQICCEPRLIIDDVKHISSKMEAALDLIDTYHENNKKCIVFSSFSQVLDLMARELHERGIKYYMLTGSTTKQKRKQRVDAFQNDDSTVFLISLKAGGTGLNLTAAEGVIHFDPWWNMSAQSQATDRAHRIGQKNTVFVYKLIMKDSIEEKIQNIQEQKKNLADAFVEGNEGVITTMTNDEIMSLFEE